MSFPFFSSSAPSANQFVAVNKIKQSCLFEYNQAHEKHGLAFEGSVEQIGALGAVALKTGTVERCLAPYR